MKKRLGLVLIMPLLVLGILYLWPRYLWAICTAPGKGWNIAKMLDVAVNVGANGQPYTTISGRAGRAKQAGRRWGCVLCRVLDWVDPNHCEDEAEKEAAMAFKSGNP